MYSSVVTHTSVYIALPFPSSRSVPGVHHSDHSTPSVLVPPIPPCYSSTKKKEMSLLAQFCYPSHSAPLLQPLFWGLSGGSCVRAPDNVSTRASGLFSGLLCRNPQWSCRCLWGSPFLYFRISSQGTSPSWDFCRCIVRTTPSRRGTGS